MTGVAVLLGTAAYMSPEQARGKGVDKLAEVWGFGCVLYEMLTGQRAFVGEDVNDMLAAVLRSERAGDRSSDRRIDRRPGREIGVRHARRRLSPGKHVSMAHEIGLGELSRPQY